VCRAISCGVLAWRSAVADTPAPGAVRASDRFAVARLGGGEGAAALRR